MDHPHKARINALFKRAEQCRNGGDFAEADKLYRDILAINPFHAGSVHAMGMMAMDLGRPDIAAELIAQAIKIDSLAPAYYSDLGMAFYNQGRIDDSIVLYRQALAMQPDLVGAANNLGIALIRVGKPEDADAVLKPATAQSPGVAELWNTLGLAHKDCGRWDEAITCFNKAIDLKPDYAQAHLNKGFLHLLRGEFAQGWAESAWRWKLPEMQDYNLAAPRWNGGDLPGKTILLHVEQGLGDSIQFIRYAPMVKAKAARVILPCPSPLAALFRAMPEIEVFEEGQALPHYDACASLMDLPGLLGTALETIPSGAPYLIPDATRAAQWRERMADLPGRKIGVVWRGRPAHLNDRNRSLNPTLLTPCLNRPDISIVNLQKDARADELGALGVPVFDAGKMLGDFADTAALISALDLVISVDTSVCHLAGAVGAKVWTLLPFAPDWRWLLNRNDTPWYPSMRLFRQPRPRDWAAVMNGMGMALDEE